MVEIIYLSPGEEMPDAVCHDPWILIEANGDGRFFGTGQGCKPSGERVAYASLSADDVSLDAAISAATRWADERVVTRIWVQRTPW